MLLGSILAYLGLTVLIGLLAARKVKNSQDFIVAGRHLPPAFNAAALFALWFGSETVFGASSAFLEKGLLGVIEDPFGGAFCFVVLGLFYAKKLYRLNILTISDLFRDRYGPQAELISAGAMVISFFGYAAAQIVALGLILEAVTGLSFILSMGLGALLVTLYTFFGGMWAVSVTDFFQSIVIIFGLACLAYYWGEAAGGVQSVLESPPPEHYRFFPDPGWKSWSDWIAAWAVLGLGSIASQDLFQRINSARSEKAAVASTFIGAGLYLLIALLPLFIVLAAAMLYPEIYQGDPQAVLPQAVLAYAPFWIQVLFFGSLLSAVMSTCSGALLAPASILSENLIKPHVKRPMNDRTFLWITRFSILFIALVAFGMALGKSNIFELVAESSIFGLVSLFIPLTAALYSRKTNAAGAILSMAFGLLTWIIFNYIYPLSIDAMFPGLLAGLTGLWLGRLPVFEQVGASSG